jgi:aminopeptidase N
MELLYRLIFFLLIILTPQKFFPQSDDSLLNASNRNYDQKNIKLELSFNFDDESVNGIETITFIPLENDFNQLILHAKTMKINEVELNDALLKFHQDGKYLFIDLNKNFDKNQLITLIIKYKANPTNGMFFFKPTKETPQIPYQIWTQGEGENNRYWYPAYDLPDDRLTTEIAATVPDSMNAISNGIISSISQNVKDKTVTYEWKMEQPHVNYLTSLVIGDYKTVKENIRGVELDYNIPTRIAKQLGVDINDLADLDYGHSPEMMNFYSNYIAPYPYKRYAQTAVQDFVVGGMENVTATTLNQRLYHTGSAEPNYNSDGLIAHEMAHQWFGDYLTCKTWDHIWLNEGFATYMNDLWTENFYGEDEFLYLRYNENEIYFDNELKYQPLDSIKIDLKVNKNKIIPVELKGGKAYQRGAAVLNTLRFYLGDKTFGNGIHHYVDKFKDSVVITSDFEKAMSKSSGRDLSTFFNEWIYGAGFPEFQVSYSWNKADKILQINVKQTQNYNSVVKIFHIPVLLEVTTSQKVFLDTLFINQREQSFSISSDQNPLMIRFNKFYKILCKVDFKKTLQELGYQIKYDDDVTGRITASKELIKFGKDAVPFLRSSLLRDNFYGVRLQDVESLKEIGGDESLKPLMLAAVDPDGRVRETAVRSLSTFSADKVGTILTSILKNDKNDYVKGAAAFSIGAMKLKGAFDILKNELKYDSHRNIIRRGAFEGLAKLGDARALPLVKEYTKYKYSYGGMHLLDITALNCAMTFVKTNRAEVIDVVAAALKNPYFRTRNYAANLLAKLNAKNKLPLLINISKKDNRLIVTRTLENAIKELEKDSTE